MLSVIINWVELKRWVWIWRGLFFRTDPRKSFINKSDYIKKNYMYMYSGFRYDYFKNSITREYKKFLIK